MSHMNPRFSSLAVLALLAAGLLAGLVWFNNSSVWIKDTGGLASWLQAIVSICAIAAIALPVLFERQLAVRRARQSVLGCADMATRLMTTVASRAFDENAAFSEWWVPQWHVIDEVMASCPIHDIHSTKALEAFITIRELFGRMRSWDEATNEGWPIQDGSMQSYVGSLCLNASIQLDILKAEMPLKD